MTFQSVFPIGDSDPMALPAKSIGPASAYFVHVFGFELMSSSEKRAVLRRDDVMIALEENGHDPDQASVYFGVSDVEALHRELAAKGVAPSTLRTDEHGGKRYRVFFAKEPYGVCFCFGQAEHSDE